MTMLPTTQDVQADAALALELIGQFFAQQIDVGAVEFETISRLIGVSADNVVDRMPAQQARIEAQAAAMIERLPGGWAQGEID